jgi:hypothetical protein
MERSGAARSRLFPRSDPLCLIQIERLRPWVPLRARAPDALTHMSVSPVAAHPSRSDSPRPILIERLGPPRTPPCPILIERFGPPRTPVAIRFPSDAGPARSASSLPLCRRHSLSRLSVLARPLARALDRRSNLGCRFLIQRLDSPDTPSRGCFA